MGGNFLWKNHEGILLNCLIESETNKIMEEFHAGDCGGHLYWKSTVDKILRAGYYWPTLFSDVKIFLPHATNVKYLRERESYCHSL